MTCGDEGGACPDVPFQTGLENSQLGLQREYINAAHPLSPTSAAAPRPP